VTTKCINACLAPVASLDGCSVVTAEGLGDCTRGFNPVQGTLPLSLPCMHLPRLCVMLALRIIVHAAALTAL
jgi:hypothetical protein